MQIKNSLEERNYEILDNGTLKIKACVYKEDVYEVTEAELRVSNDYRKTSGVLYPLKSFSDKMVLEQLATVPLILGHAEVDIANMSDLKIGNVVGVPEVLDGKIYLDLIVDDAETIIKIQNRTLRDISLYFNCNVEKSSGSYNNKNYNYVLSNINFNHIGLLPIGQGRMGDEVAVMNKSQDIGEKMDQNNQLEEFKKELERISIENQKLKQENADLVEQTKEDVIDKKIAEAAIENKKAIEIDEQFSTKIANCGLYGKKLYTKTLTDLGATVDKWTDDALKCGFEVAVAIANKIKHLESSMQIGNKTFVGNSTLTNKIALCSDADELAVLLDRENNAKK